MISYQLPVTYQPTSAVMTSSYHCSQPTDYGMPSRWHSWSRYGHNSCSTQIFSSSQPVCRYTPGMMYTIPSLHLWK